MGVERGVSERDAAIRRHVRGVEDVAEALLDGDGDIRLRSRLVLPHRCLLVLGQLAEAGRRLQCPQREPARHLAPHPIDLRVFRHDEQQVVAQEAEAGTI